MGFWEVFRSSEEVKAKEFLNFAGSKILVLNVKNVGLGLKTLLICKLEKSQKGFLGGYLKLLPETREKKSFFSILILPKEGLERTR